MEKSVAPDGIRATKQTKRKKKQQPLKVVYITNPMKFTATASEFRALVQELTGQDADVSDFSRFAAADGGGEEEAGKVASEGNAHAAEGLGRGGGSGGAMGGSDMIDDFQGFASSSLWRGDVHVNVDDVFKRLGAM